MAAISKRVTRLSDGTLRVVDRLYNTPTPYIAAWHQAPVNRGRDDIRLMLQITSPRRDAGKLKFLAGSESAMGAFIGDIEPETTAARRRAALAAVADRTSPKPPDWQQHAYSPPPHRHR